MDIFLRKAITYVLVIVLGAVVFLSAAPSELSWIDLSITSLILLTLAFESARQFKKFLHAKQRRKEEMV
jgi:heme/copper-type cytochrome/quinol oxidase subunit 4